MKCRAGSTFGTKPRHLLIVNPAIAFENAPITLKNLYHPLQGHRTSVLREEFANSARRCSSD